MTTGSFGLTCQIVLNVFKCIEVLKLVLTIYTWVWVKNRITSSQASVSSNLVCYPLNI